DHHISLISTCLYTPATPSYTFPYTTLFRSLQVERAELPGHRGVDGGYLVERQGDVLAHGVVGVQLDGDRGVAAGPVEEDVEASRSEEHTSELQSQSNLVWRLLLEKKNLVYV